MLTKFPFATNRNRATGPRNRTKKKNPVTDVRFQVSGVGGGVRKRAPEVLLR